MRIDAKHVLIGIQSQTYYHGQLFAMHKAYANCNLLTTSRWQLQDLD